MTILIGCDSFLALRNVRNGNLADHLPEERIVALVDPNQYEGALQVGPDRVEIDKLIEFNPFDEPDLEPYIERAYLARKAYYDPATLWTKQRAAALHRNRNRPLKKQLSVLRARWQMMRYWMAGRRGNAQQWRVDFIERLRQNPIIQQYCALFEKYDAQLVVAFSLEGYREMALTEAAHVAGIPVVVMIRSRDNLAAKIQHIPDASAYIVWSDVMSDFLAYLYPEFDRNLVHVTGSPQFDRHLNPDHRLSREAFFERIGLDPAKPLIVYTTATPGLIQQEIDICQHLADAVQSGYLKGQLLVRGHPRGFGSDFRLLHHIPEGVAVYPQPTNIPLRSPEHEAIVVQHILDDEPVHLATLAYQDVQVNVSGTMIVDSAILDKPTVGVYYDLPPDIPDGLSARRFYKRTDMQHLIDSGGLRLAKSPEHCIELINDYLAHPELDAAGRQQIRDTDCGPLDGQAGKRIADILRQHRRR